MINKINNLSRLHWPLRFTVISYWFKSIFGVKVSYKEKSVYSYFNHLVRLDGKEIRTDAVRHFSKFKGLDSTFLYLRRAPSSDMMVLSQVYWYKQYAPAVQLFYNYFYEKESQVNIIDAGANIGLTSLYFSKTIPHASIFAIEPDSDNYNTILENIEANKIENIKGIEGALWFERTVLNLFANPKDDLEWAFRVKPAETNKNRNVEGYTINNICSDHNIEHIDILKIDIEGAEKEIFLNDTADITFLNKTAVIAIEVHKEFMSYAQMKKILDQFHFNSTIEGELLVGYNTKLANAKV